MPLYACERCGYTSAAFRPEAARLHRLEYPDCDGVMRIIFRSEESHRGDVHTPPAALQATAPVRIREGQPPAGSAIGPSRSTRRWMKTRRCV